MNEGTRLNDRSVGAGRDFSVLPPALLSESPLMEFDVTQAGEYAVQNQSEAAVQVVFDDRLTEPSIYQLGAGETIDPMVWFIGRVRIYGAAGSQIFVRAR